MLEIQPGSFFGGRYAVIKTIGAGGMGSVFLAKHPEKEDSLVAIKVLYPGKIKEHEARERFRNEIKACLKIDHPNVVRAYEYFDEADFQAYAMEYVDAGDLLGRMKEGSLGIERSVSYLKQMLKGLIAVHAEGIMHRDLKPDNLLITKDDVLKLSDFGVARLKGASQLTLVGAMVGTPKYLSPEYVETGKCDQRGDLFAVGVIGYEMLSGQSPYKSITKVSMMVERLKVRVDPLFGEVAGCSKELSDIIEKAMEVDVDKRYQSAKEMLEALEELEKGGEISPENVVVSEHLEASGPTITTTRITAVNLQREGLVTEGISKIPLVFIWAGIPLSCAAGVWLGIKVIELVTGHLVTIHSLFSGA